jgi:hypothetical protein
VLARVHNLGCDRTRKKPKFPKEISATKAPGRGGSRSTRGTHATYVPAFFYTGEIAPNPEAGVVYKKARTGRSGRRAAGVRPAPPDALLFFRQFLELPRQFWLGRTVSGALGLADGPCAGVVIVRGYGLAGSSTSRRAVAVGCPRSEGGGAAQARRAELYGGGDVCCARSVANGPRQETGRLANANPVERRRIVRSRSDSPRMAATDGRNQGRAVDDALGHVAFHRGHRRVQARNLRACAAVLRGAS